MRREYQGDIALKPGEEEKIVESLNDKPVPMNEKLRDGLVYNLKLNIGKNTFQRVFDESNIPFQLRDFIDRIKNNP